MAVAGGFADARAENSACWGDASRGDISCVKITEKLLLGFRGQTVSFIQKAMNLPQAVQTRYASLARLGSPSSGSCATWRDANGGPGEELNQPTSRLSSARSNAELPARTQNYSELASNQPAPGAVRVRADEEAAGADAQHVGDAVDAEGLGRAGSCSDRARRRYKLQPDNATLAHEHICG
jgi:hypothetical protein